jgi:hypothetical protein
MEGKHLMPMHDNKAMDTAMSKTVGRIKETVVGRMKKKKRMSTGQGGSKTKAVC